MQMPSASSKKRLDAASKAYMEQLETPEGMYAKHYLAMRKISPEAQTYFRLGFVKDAEEGDEFEVGRLSIPYITPTGVVGLKFRAIPLNGIPGNPEDSPKYKYRTGFTTTIFNTRDLQRQEQLVCITEGELDTVSAWMAGYPSVAVPGVKNWRPVFARAFRFRKVAILADNDDSGQGLEFARMVQKDIHGSRIVLMPDGMDVNKLVVEDGLEALKRMVTK
jgi:DNA primase